MSNKIGKYTQIQRATVPVDATAKVIDRKLFDMENQIKGIYATAGKETQEKFNAYMERLGKQVESYEKAYKGAIANGDKEAMRKAKAVYQEAMTKAQMKDKWYRGQMEEISQQYLHASETAAAIINGETPEIYTLTYNGFGKDATSDIPGYSFNMVNTQVVTDLINDDKLRLPVATIDSASELANTNKAINSQLLQGVVQGESIPDIAARIAIITERKERQAISMARTMVTSVEGEARQHTLEKCEDDGIIMGKTWYAAHDSRTRDSHAALDNVTIKVNEKFDNGLLYPGDPHGEPAEVYNCRCCIVGTVLGFKKGFANGETDSNVKTGGTGLTKLFDKIVDVALDTAKKKGGKNE
jgi:uncharacterized protein with gpF-like domain